MYGSETMIWKVMDRSRIKAVQMDNFRGFLCIRRKSQMHKYRICVVMKGVIERNDEGVVLW